MPKRSNGLRTRVGRRVLAMFIACALVPVTIAIGVFHGWVKDALIEGREAQLAQNAQTYTSALLERLSAAEHSLPEVEIARGGSNHRWFLAVAEAESDADPKLIFGNSARPPPRPTDPAVLAHLQAGNSIVVVHTDGSGRPSVWLLRHAPSGKRLLMGELMPVALWGDPDDLPASIAVCVFDIGRQPLYCSTPGHTRYAERIHPKAGHSPFGRSEWSDGSDHYRTSFREVFLPSHFRSPSWLVVMTQPESRTLATANTVARIFIPAIALGVLIALFLALTHVRLTLGPLASLRAATQRLAAREFDVRLQPVGNDEFTELGHAFNDMSAQLGRQFDAMQALAEIDGVILSKVGVAQVAQFIAQRIAALVPAECCYLLIADSTRARRFAIHASGPTAPAGPVETLLEQSVAEQLWAARDGWCGSARQCGIHAADGTPLLPAQSHAFVLPVVLNDALAGLIVLARGDSAGPSADQIELLKRLADRIAVAIEAARRDAELQRNANFDSLTQLPNRRAFMAELPTEMARAAEENRRLAVLFVDLDGFSNVNDTFGHAVGDELLVQAAGRLRTCVRKWDTVARLGGDEFVATLLELNDARDAATIAEHCVEVLGHPFMLSSGTAYVSASIGIAMFPGDGDSAAVLLQHADMAMYRAKANGRAGYAFFEAEMDRDAQNRMAMNVDLRRALEQRELVLHYQPQLDLRSRRIVGVEALIRWNHPTRGVLFPTDFIGVAEETGLIEQIGQWIMERASRQFVAWRKQGLPLEYISVNVSPRQFRQRDFVGLVTRVVNSTRIEASRLHLEITESVLLEGPDTLAPTLTALQALGTPLALDDFGTGYSSFAYLQHLPVSTIKLDRTFVADITGNPSSRALVRAAIEMVHALRKQIVVEGVETQAQAALLSEWGCDAIQGYLLSQPVPAETFAALVRAQPTPALPPAESLVS